MGQPAGYQNMVNIDYNGAAAPSSLPNGGVGYKAVLNQPDAWQNGDQYQSYLSNIGAVQSPDKGTWYVPSDKFVQPAIKQESDWNALGPLGDIMNIVVKASPIGPVVNTAMGLASGNVGQTLSGVMGLPGVGNAVNGMVGSTLSDLGVPSSMLPYVTKGITSAGTSLLSGASPEQSILNGLASGAGTYVGNATKGALSFLPQGMDNAISQATAGALGTAIKGGDIGTSALLSGLNGLGQGFGIQGAGNALAPLIQQPSQSSTQTARAKLLARIAALKRTT